MRGLRPGSEPPRRSRLLPSLPEAWPSGFSLLELMIALLLVAVLLSLAIPNYQRYTLRVHRTSAIETLLAIASCQQSLYAERLRYDTRQCIPQDSGGYYSFRLEPPDTASTTVFTAIANPLAGQQADPCQSLALNQSGWRSISGPQELHRKCWEGR